ncbi:MAG: PglZ domain-containing protein [Deltaproteobacteria bacterium]|nr:PglZ domain-containing protein [Deltaproteobacteria bacterium]
MVTKQVHDAGIVVWYDPERSYVHVAEQITVPDATVIRFCGSFFELRAQLEPLLEFVDTDGHPRPERTVPPHVLVYMPMDRRETHYALIEAESAGHVIEPGANPWQRNTRLKVIAERVFKDLAPDRAGDVARQVEQGILTLEDLDRLAEQSAAVGSGAVKLIFGTASVEDVALMFAASEKHDAATASKQALPEIALLLASELGVAVDANGSITAARHALRRVLLLSEFVAAVRARGGTVPEFESAGLPARDHHMAMATKVCQTWRRRSDYREAYVAAAREVDAEVAIGSLNLEAQCLAGIETFPSVEEKLLRHAEQTVFDGTPERARDLAEQRKRSFWSTEEPTNQLRWSLIETAALVILTAARLKAELKNVAKTPAAFVKAYVAGSEPWCLLDTYHRHLERQFAIFDLEIGGEHDLIEQVIHRARQQYMDAVALCAEAFTAALDAADFSVADVLHQEKIFPNLVAPLTKSGKESKGKPAYIWVDAMRFEMGREFVDGLGDELEVKLIPGIAQLPTITEVGMSALLPGADHGAELVEAGAGKVALKIGGNILKDRAGRVKHLRDRVGGKVVDVKLNELIKPSKKLRDEISAADFVLVTSQEIDRRGESAEDEDEARRYMDEVLDKLRKGVRRLASLDVTDVVITADHGHLFGEAIESGMKIDPPGGDTADLHRRVWIGKGGSSADGFVRVPASRVGLGGDLELALPRSLACFKAGGSESFFHGAASLQELIIPVAVVKAKRDAVPAGQAVIALTMERPRIATRFFSVTATYSLTEFFGAEEKRVKAVVRANKKDIGSAVMAGYGFEDGTQEIVLRKDKPNAITLMLPADADMKIVSVHILDAASQVELKRLDDVEVAIGI